MIRPLSSDLQHRIRSGVAITSFTQCVEELVLNSLDASSSCVAIRVDVPLGKIQVVDNGKGISRQDLESVASRYCTSKCHVVEDLNNLVHYGYRGEALASVRDICLLVEVESRCHDNTDTYLKIFKKGEALPTTESLKNRPSHGCTITVHDLFHKLAVRKKALNTALEFERVRHCMEAIALIHPSVSFTLRNDATCSKVLQTHKSNSVLKAFGDLFGSAKARYMKAVSCSEGAFKVNGHISTDGHSNKSLQYVFINERLVLKTKMHKLISHLIAKCGFLKQKASYPPKTGEGDTQGSPSRNIDRHAVYVVNISCALTEYDITFDPAKTLVEFKNWPSVLNCVEVAVKDFLRAEKLASDVNLDELSPEVKQIFHTEECLQVAEDKDDSEDKPYGDDISTVEFRNNLQSLTALRRDVCRDEVMNDDSVVAEIACISPVSTTAEKVNPLSSVHLEGLRRIREKFQKKKNVRTMRKFTPKKTANIDLLKGLSKIRARLQASKGENSISNVASPSDATPMEENTSPISDASNYKRRSISPNTNIESKIIKIANSFLTSTEEAVSQDEFQIMSPNTLSPKPIIQTCLQEKSVVESRDDCNNRSTTVDNPDTLPTSQATRNFMTSEDMVQTIDDVNFNLINYQTEDKNPKTVDTTMKEETRKLDIQDNRSTLLQELCGKLYQWKGDPHGLKKYEAEVDETSTSPEPKRVRFKLGGSTESESEVSVISSPACSDSVAHSVCGDYIMDMIPLEEEAPNPLMKEVLPRQQSQGFDVTALLRSTVTEEPQEISKKIESTSSESEKCFNDEDAKVSKEWLTSKDPKTGKPIYIHRISGNTSYTLPGTDVSEALVTNSQMSFVTFDADDNMMPRKNRMEEPAPLSPASAETLKSMMKEHDEEDEQLSTIKWKQPANGISELKSMLRDWVNPVFNQPGKAVMTADGNEITRTQIKAKKFLHKHTFTKDMLQSIEVVNQVDDKFILCLMKTEDHQGKSIVIIDQHAAHERVRLEQLIEDAHQSDQDGVKHLRCISIEPPIEPILTSRAIRVLKAYPNQLKRIGIECKFDNGPNHRVLVFGVPACVQSRDANEKRRGHSDFLLNFTQELLTEQVDILEATHGANSALPRGILRVLAAQACGGAIKFGDSISVEECERLVRGLQTCDLPFQCAHGRPSLIPLVDLKSVPHYQENKSRPNLWKLRQAVRIDQDGL